MKNKIKFQSIDWIQIQKKYDNKQLTVRQIERKLKIPKSFINLAEEKNIFIKKKSIIQAINWEQVQKDHDNGLTWNQLSEKYNFYKDLLNIAAKKGVFISRNKSQAGIIAIKNGKINNLINKDFNKDKKQQIKVLTKNWEEIQKSYNQEFISYKVLNKKFGISNGLIQSAIKKGLFIPRSHSQAIKIASKNPLTKQKKSHAAKQRLRIHPEQHPLILGRNKHHNKQRTYPQQFLFQWLNKNSIKFIQQYNFLTYKLDFYIQTISKRKIDLQIDGQCHFQDQRRVNHDTKRNKEILECGLQIKRIRWSDFRKLNKNDSVKFLQDLKLFLTE